MPSNTRTFEYAFHTSKGVDHRLIALYSVRQIANGFDSATSVRSPSWEEKLQSFISTIIFRADLSIDVLVHSLFLVERFQDILKISIQSSATTLDDAKRLFLVSYMIAAKVMFDNQMTLVWWKKVIQREYDCDDLSDLEFRFYQILDWDVQMDDEHFHRISHETLTWYENFVAEHTLPASPLPTYQPLHSPPMALKRSRMTEELRRTGESKTSGQLELPLPCTAMRAGPQTSQLGGSLISLGRRIFQLVDFEE